MLRSLVLCLGRALTCVFGRFAVHGPRLGTPLPSILRLSRVALIRGLSWAGIRTCRTHRTGRVSRIPRGRLHDVGLWGVSLGWQVAWVAGSGGTAALVRRRLLKVHVRGSGVHPKKTEIKVGRDKFSLFLGGVGRTENTNNSFLNWTFGFKVWKGADESIQAASPFVSSLRALIIEASPESAVHWSSHPKVNQEGLPASHSSPISRHFGACLRGFSPRQFEPAAFFRPTGNLFLCVYANVRHSHRTFQSFEPIFL